MEGFFGERRAESPEEQLIYAILESYVVDMRLAPRRRTGEKKMQFLLEEARTPWTAELCLWLDVDHEWFCDALEKLARDLGYENRI